MKNTFLLIICFLGVFTAKSQIHQYHEALKFNQIPSRWDEGLPLGNGMIGQLIWQKDTKLRFSLDHAELWDLRPMAELHTPGFNYKMVKEKVLANQYTDIQKIGDIPYEREPAPSKLPGAALEFDIKNWGELKSATLNIELAEASIVWKNGIKMVSFVDATKNMGYFKFENIDKLEPELFAPKYESNENKSAGGSTTVHWPRRGRARAAVAASRPRWRAPARARAARARSRSGVRRTTSRPPSPAWRRSPTRSGTG